MIFCRLSTLIARILPQRADLNSHYTITSHQRSSLFPKKMHVSSFLIISSDPGWVFFLTSCLFSFFVTNHLHFSFAGLCSTTALWCHWLCQGREQPSNRTVPTLRWLYQLQDGWNDDGNAMSSENIAVNYRAVFFSRYGWWNKYMHVCMCF